MYWASQIAGWGFFVLGNIAWFLEKITQAYLIWRSFINRYPLLTTHFFRYLVHRWKWNNLVLSSLIPRVIISVVAMSILFTTANTVLVNM